MVTPIVLFTITSAAAGLLSVILTLTKGIQDLIIPTRHSSVAVLLTVLWGFSYTLMLLTWGIFQEIAFHSFTALGIILPYFWLLFIIEVYRDSEESLPLTYLILIVPAVFLLLLATNSIHKGFFSQFSQYTLGPLTPLNPRWEWMANIHISISLIVLLVDLILLLLYFPGTNSYFQKKIIPTTLLFSLVFLLEIWDLFFSPLALRTAPYLVSYIFVLFLPVIIKTNLLEVAPVRYSKVVESIPDLILVLDKDFVVLDINPAAQQKLKVPGRWAIGRSLGEVSYPLFEFLNHKQESSPYHTEFMLGDSEVPHFYSINVQPMKIGIGSRQGHLVVLRDITAIKEIDKALEASVLRYQTLFTQAYDSIIITDMDQKLIDVNPAATRLLGYSKKNFLKMNLTEIYVKETHRHNLQIPDLTAEPLFETELRHKSGYIVPVEVTVSPLDLPGEPMYLYFFRDITERKKAQITMKRAKDTAEEASRAKSAFLANMSHEIRTPLNAVIGMSSLLLNTTMPPQQQEYVETIRSSSETLLSIINDILDLSKIEAGKIEMDINPFVLRECIEDVMDLSATKANLKGINISYNISEETPVIIKSDISRLRQILLNLMSNGIKFTNHGEVSLQIKSRLKEENRVALEFTITDTGIGIPQERLDRLFKTFSQVDSSTTRKYGGSGLGLAISKQLCEMMGGYIEVNSVPDSGSVFRFSIEALREVEPTVIPDYLSSQDWGQDNSALALVPTEAMSSSMKDFFRHWNIPLATALTTQEGLTLLKEQDFSLIFVDQELIQESALVSAIREAKESKGTLIFNLDYFTHNQNFPLYNDTIRKPLRITNIFYTLQRYLGSVPAKVYPRTDENRMEENFAFRYPLQILLVEDNGVNQKVALLLLKKLGYSADVANNGIEAIEAIKLKRYDLILMDDHMPMMDGVEATAQIRRILPKDRQPTIVAVTANAMPESREKYLRAGMEDYIKKPVEVPRLTEVLKKTAHNHQVELWEEMPQAPRPIPQEEDITSNPEVRSLFISDTRRILEEMQEAFEKGNIESLQIAAHTLKSTCHITGADRLSRQAATIEERCKEGNIANMEQALLILRKEALRVVDQMEKNIKSDESP